MQVSIVWTHDATLTLEVRPSIELHTVIWQLLLLGQDLPDYTQW